MSGTASGDVVALREIGQVCRPVAELGVPIAAWRAAIRDAARAEGMRIRIFLIDPASTSPAQPGRAGVEMVCAVRIDSASGSSGARTDPLWWRRVDDLLVTVAVWRAMLRRTARRDRLGIRTFLVPSTVDGLVVGADQLVFAMWINRPDRGDALLGSRHVGG